MTVGISITRLWSDEDMVTLRIDICDGASRFTTEIYVGHQHLADTVSGLERFRHHIHGGLFNLRFGEFGSEYASGALDVRMHFRQRARLFMRVAIQAPFSTFEDRPFASEGTFYLLSEPALLDRFVGALRVLSEGGDDDAELDAIGWH